MSQPTENAGNIQQAAAIVEGAMQTLQQAMAKLPVASPEWTAINDALGKLAKPFAKQQAGDLVPAQILQMAQAQQASPLMQILAQQQPPGGGGAPPQGV